MPVKLDMSFVITTKGSKYLKECLSRLDVYLSDKTDWEVLVANDGGGLDISELPTYVRVVDVGKCDNPSFAHCANVGVNAASDEFSKLCLMHDDALLLDSTDIVEMYDEIGKEAHGGVIKVVSGKGVSRLGVATSTYMSMTQTEPNKVDFLEKWVGWHKRASKINTKAAVLAVVSGLWVLSKDTWNDLDGFDENYRPNMFEDSDFCLRAYPKGYRVSYYPKCEFEHITCVSIPTDFEMRSIIMKRNLQLLADTHHDTINEIILGGDKNEGDTAGGGKRDKAEAVDGRNQ